MITIVELVDVCARECGRSGALFERLGAWVPDTRHGPLQRLFANACHRHAWHAELWSGRAPTVPLAADLVGPPVIADADTDPDRWAAYAAALGVARSDLETLRSRVDPDLDPSTARVLDLVGNDLRQLTVTVTGIRF